MLCVLLMTLLEIAEDCLCSLIVNIFWIVGNVKLHKRGFLTLKYVALRSKSSLSCFFPCFISSSLPNFSIISWINFFPLSASSCNTYTKTFDGINGAGRRLADEVSNVWNQ